MLATVLGMVDMDPFGSKITHTNEKPPGEAPRLVLGEVHREDVKEAQSIQYETTRISPYPRDETVKACLRAERADALKCGD